MTSFDFKRLGFLELRIFDGWTFLAVGEVGPSRDAQHSAFWTTSRPSLLVRCQDPFDLVKAQVELFGRRACVRVDPLDVKRVG